MNRASVRFSLMFSAMCLGAQFLPPALSPAHAIPINFAVNLDGYAVNGVQADTPPDAPDCIPGIPCPPPGGSKREISFALNKKPMMPIKIVVLPDVSPDDIEKVGEEFKLLGSRAMEIIDAVESQAPLYEAILTALIASIPPYPPLNVFLKILDKAKETMEDLNNLDEDTDLVDIATTFVPDHTPFAAAILIYDPDTRTYQSVVAVPVVEPPGLLPMGIGVIVVVLAAGPGGLPRRRRT